MVNAYSELGPGGRFRFVVFRDLLSAGGSTSASQVDPLIGSLRLALDEAVRG
jgi:hypothetical protein